MSDRAVVYIDGNNWYHSLKENGVVDQGNLNYAKISLKFLDQGIGLAQDIMSDVSRNEGIKHFMLHNENSSQGFVHRITESQHILVD